MAKIRRITLTRHLPGTQGAIEVNVHVKHSDPENFDIDTVFFHSSRFGVPYSEEVTGFIHALDQIGEYDTLHDWVSEELRSALAEKDAEITDLRQYSIVAIAGTNTQLLNDKNEAACVSRRQ